MKNNINHNNDNKIIDFEKHRRAKKILENIIKEIQKSNAYNSYSPNELYKLLRKKDK